MKRVLFSLILVLVSAAAPGQELRPAARELRARALRAYNIQRYPEAIDAFQSAYQIDPQPELLYALAQAERMNGDCRRAIDAYRAFLRSNPPSQQAAPARKNISRCEAQLATSPPAPPSNATAPLPNATAPLPSATAPSANATAPLPAIVTLGDASPLPPRRVAAHDTAGHVLMALGAAGLVTGGALWGIAEGQIDAANQATRYDQFAAAHAAAAHAESQRIGGIVAVAAGAALAIAAAIHYGIWVRGR